ncbi:MAG TPA: efflux RND transporter permease subunit [Gammaproteobacteria bacterium]|nr:efflux RND transporter permease subunit [Gammaproteobacteria bacterium]
MSARLNIAGRLGKAAMESYITPTACLLISLFGLVALFVTPREENPQIDVPAANVFVRMPGATPEEALNLIVRPLEAVLQEMTGVDHTYGMASDSLGMVTVQFEVGEDKEASLVKLYDRLMHNLDRIPPGASQPMVKPSDVDDVPILTLTFSSDHYSDLELKRLVDRVKEQLSPLPDVTVVDVIGGRDRQITIDIDPERLASYGIPLGQLYRSLSAGNFAVPVGDAVDDNRVKLIRLDGALRNAREVGRIVVAVQGESPVYLRDVADIHDDGGEILRVHRVGFGPASGMAMPAAEPEQVAVTLTLAKKRGSNAVVVARRVLDKLETLKGDLIPDDIRVTVSRNSGERADDAVNLLIEHLAIAIVSVVVILLLFLGWREAAIVTLNIPLILFIVLAIGYVAGQTINRITLFALILALGLLVDDAIVVIENIHRHLEKGAATLREKGAAIITATNETGKPTIIATIAVILAFIPMAFVTGMMGPYMGPIPFNTPVAMLASLVIAYMFTPWIARRWLPCRLPAPTLEEAGEREADWLHRLYSRLARPLLERHWPRRAFWAVLGLAFVVVMWQPAWQFLRPEGMGGPLTPGTVELKMLPKGNKNTFNITIDMPEGTPLEITDAVTRDIGDILRRHPMVTDYETHVGMAGPVDFNGMLRGATIKQGPHVAEIRVNLVKKQERHIKSAEIVLQLRDWLRPVYERWPGANIKLVEDPPGPPVRATLLGEIYGPDYETARRLARTVRAAFETTWDVVDVDDSVTDDQVQYRVTVDKEKAAAAGVDTASVANLLRDFVAGFDIGKLDVVYERHPVAIHIQLPRRFRIAPRDLDRLFVTTADGTQIPVASIARVEKVPVPKPIFTKDGFPVVYVTGEPATGSQVYPLLDLDRRLDGQELLPGVTLHTGGLGFLRPVADPAFQYQMMWDGEMRLTLDVFRDLGAAFIVAIVLIYLLLVAYYGSFLLPVIVMGAIPLTMIGIFPGHLITHQPFTATSMIGMIALAGIVVRNSVLLIDFILENRARGVDLKTAVLEAGAVRTRPILLTALAVIAGTSIMISDPVFGGLGVSMAFGTFASTLLTLFVIPLIYYLWQRRRGDAPATGASCTT